MTALPKSQELPQGTTQAAKELDPRKGLLHAHKESGFLVSESEVYEDRPPGYDFTHLSDNEIRSFGGNPDKEVPVWIRSPKFWEKIEGQSRALQFVREAGGRRIPCPGGEFIENQDLILAFKSRAEVESNIRAEKQDADYMDRVLAGEDDIRGDRPIPRWKSGNLTQDDSRREHDRNVMAGIIGPTKDRDWTEVASRNPEKFLQDKAKFLGGNITASELGEFEKQRVDELRSESKRGKSFAVGFGKDVTPNSALAQARARK
jgi:hypothetical protein